MVDPQTPARVGGADPAGAGTSSGAEQPRPYRKSSNSATAPDRVLAVLERNQRARLQVALATYRGVTGVDVRIHELFSVAGGYGPTKAGIRLRASELDQVITALIEARAALAGEPGVST